MKGKSVYLTNDELDFIYLTLANQDNFPDEEEEKLHSNIYDKIRKARNK